MYVRSIVYTLITHIRTPAIVLVVLHVLRDLSGRDTKNLDVVKSTSVQVAVVLSKVRLHGG